MIRPQPKPTRAPKKARQPLKRLRWMVKKAPRRITRPGPGSDPVYLAHVRNLPCRVLRVWVNSGVRFCEGDTVAHHAGPKTNDSTAVPLCVKHHAQWHDLNGVFKGWKKADRRGWADRAIEDIRSIIAGRRERATGAGT